MDELEHDLWDNRIWDMSLKADKVMDAYREATAGMDEDPAPPIDSLPHKDWLRA